MQVAFLQVLIDLHEVFQLSTRFIGNVIVRDVEHTEMLVAFEGFEQVGTTRIGNVVVLEIEVPESAGYSMCVGYL